MKLNVKEIAVFSMLGAMMYASRVLMELLPNMHLIGVFIVAMTVVYRKKALYPLYVFVFVTGLLNGFATWWIPYLYIWAVLWGAVMLLPQNMPTKIKPVVYMIVCGLHGLLYGVLYAPAQAILFGLDFKGMLTWIAAGLPFDVTHGVSNLLCGVLIMPLASVLKKSEKVTA
ncbi:MAG: hypothetical protein IJE14_10155 [Clostridia bacterium]|nr:hypothetical protein [Clostridia bacterium]